MAHPPSLKVTHGNSFRESVDTQIAINEAQQEPIDETDALSKIREPEATGEKMCSDTFSRGFGGGQVVALWVRAFIPRLFFLVSPVLRSYS